MNRKKAIRGHPADFYKHVNVREKAKIRNRYNQIPHLTISDISLCLSVVHGIIDANGSAQWDVLGTTSN